jgi:transglutaminase-like putative cysteine protease
MAGAGLLAFAGGAGFELLAGLLGATGLAVAFVWCPGQKTAARLERAWVPLALVFVGRALVHVFIIQDDIVVPVVDLLLLLLCAEALRAEDAENEPRIYALSFALILAATAYRPGVVFAVAFTLYVVFGTLAMIVGNLRAQMATHPGAKLAVDRRTVSAGVLIAVATLLISGVIFLAFPRVSRGWAARGAPPVRSVAGFSDQVSLGGHGSRIYPNPQIVLRVEFEGDQAPSPARLYWRGRSFDRFDGVRWYRSRNPPPAVGNREWYRNRWAGPEVEYRVYATRLDSRVLFALHPLVDVSVQSAIYPFVDNVGDYGYGGSGAPTYTARSMSGRPPPEALRAAEFRSVPGGQLYLQLPRDVEPRVLRLADSLTSAAPTPYDKVLALESWFREEFSYTRDLPVSAREATLEHFLFERRAGHCEYFSTALAVMLRALGIPSREVNGFLGGQWSEFGQYLAVTQNEAHSWVEVWFPGLGWVPFDPTPASGSNLRATQSWLWPGRFLMDGLQYRWSRWILDYSIDNQTGILDRLSGVGPNEEGLEDLGPRIIRWLRIPAILAVLAGLGLALMRLPGIGGAGRMGPESRIYLRLREGYERKYPPLRGTPPLEFSRSIREAGWPGANDVDRIVGRYLEVRFGGRTLPPAELSRMKASLRAARRGLRQT